MRKFCKATISFLMVVGSLVQLSAQTVEIGSFGEAWQYTQNHSSVLKIASTETQMANKDVKMAYSALLPQASVRANFQNNLDLPVTLIPGELVGQPAGTYQETQFGKKYNYTANLNATWELVNVEYWHKLKETKLKSEVASWSEQINEQQLREDLGKVYYLTLLRREALAISKENLQQSETLLTLANQKREMGFLDEISYNEIRINQQEIRENMLQNNEALENNLATLKKLMGMGENTSLLLTDDLETENPKALQDTVFHTSQEVQMKMSQLELSETMLKETKGAFLPTVSLYGNFGIQQFRDDFSMEFNENSWNPANSVGVQIGIPVFGGGYRINQVNRQKLNVVQAEQVVRETLLSEKTDFENSLTTYSHKLEIWENGMETLKLYKQNVDLSQQKLDQDLIGLPDHLETFTKFLNAQSRYLNQLADYLIANLELSLKLN